MLWIHNQKQSRDNTGTEFGASECEAGKSTEPRIGKKKELLLRRDFVQGRGPVSPHDLRMGREQMEIGKEQ